MDQVRFGTLGAARITPMALVKPVKAVEESDLVAVAARDRSRAQKYARKHRIPRVHGSYDELLADPEVDAVYNPLPNGLHAEWTTKALEAGKHVLCEKPFTSNASEAREVAEVARRAGLTVMEAFHWRYHPLAVHVRELVAAGAIGDIEHVEAQFCFPLVLRNDIRYRWDLAGGAMMDAGCYTISMLRHLTGEEPEVVSARAATLRRDPRIDRRMDAEFRFPGGATGSISASLFSRTLVKLAARVRGSRGEIKVFNPLAPQFVNRVAVKADGGTEKRRFTREPTYNFQLRAFCAAVLEGQPMLTPPLDAVRNMELVDAVYHAAGLPRRGT